MKLKLLGLLLIAGVAVSSCKKDNTAENLGNDTIGGIKAPEGFTWSSSRDVTMSIGITDNSFQNAIHVIQIFDGDPANGGQLLSKGSATLVSPYNTKITLSSITKDVYVEKISPNGESLIQKIVLNSDKISVAMSATEAVQTFATAKTGKRAGISAINEPNPTIPSTGVTTIPAGSSWFAMTNNGVYKIVSSGTYSFNDPSSNNTLYIAGGTSSNPVIISQIKLQNGFTVIVGDGAHVTFENIYWESNGHLKNFGTIRAAGQGEFKVNTNGTFRNQGNFTVVSSKFVLSAGSANVINTSTGIMLIGGSFESDGTFENDGTINVSAPNDASALKNSQTFTNNGTLNFNGSKGVTFSGTLVNKGTLTVNEGAVTFNGNDNQVTNNEGSFTATKSRVHIIGKFTNKGTVLIKELYYSGGNSLIDNYCQFTVNTAADIDAAINNRSYFHVKLDASLDGLITQTSGAMFHVGSASVIDKPIKGPTSGGRALFKSDGNIDVNLFANSGELMFYDKLDVCIPSSQTLKAGNITGGAAQNCSLSIPITTCNPTGNGPQAGDTDGIPDDLDDYDDDPLRAYNNKVQLWGSGGYTFAFEDNWPSKGDYDLNDMVITARYNIVTSASNNVVDIIGDFELKATGGEFKNGFGVEFPVAREKVKDGIFYLSINGGAEQEVQIESGQTNAVAILFNDSREQQTFWNTIKNNPTSSSVKYSIRIELSNGPHIDTFGIGFYNPFIWNSQKGRQYETHLFGKTPTTKAINAPFGTGEDSGTSVYYSTNDGLPWAIEVPASSFAYPIEKTPITQAYTMFQTWATSGGTNPLNWYSNQNFIVMDKVYSSTQN